MKNTLALLTALALTSANAFAQTKMAPVAPGQNPPTQVIGTTDMSHGRNHGKDHGKDHRKDHKTPEQNADHRAGKMAKELGLNADQEAKVEALLLAENQKMTTLHGTATPGTRPSPGQRAEMKTVHDKYDGQLKAILNPEQYAKLMARRNEKREEMKGKRGERMKGKK